MSAIELATIASTAPLAVYMDADSVNPVPCRLQSAYVPVVGDRVSLQLMTPLSPIIIDKVTS